MSMQFENRRDAGLALIASGRLDAFRGRADVIVLALPPGGVPIADVVARELDAPLDAFVIKELSLPLHGVPSMGAVAPGGVVVRHDEVIDGMQIPEGAVDRIVEMEKPEVAARDRDLRGTSTGVDVSGKIVVVVDDGLSSASMLGAAAEALRARGARQIVVAAPVLPEETARVLAGRADEIVSLESSSPSAPAASFYDEVAPLSDADAREQLAQHAPAGARDGAHVLWFDDERSTSLALVGGKNASLAHMTRSLGAHGIRVPPGFAVTAGAYRLFLDENRLTDRVESELAAINADEHALQKRARAIREMIVDGTVPGAIVDSISDTYLALGRRLSLDDPRVAVRSSATAEDLPEASFAGQQETFLNVAGVEAVVDAYRRCLASLFTDRAIAYRQAHGIAHLDVAISVGVQALVRADLACAGVMFTIDTESGFPDVVLINAAWGLGENVVKGAVNPDELVLFKPFLDDPKLRPVLRTRIGEKEHTMVLGERGRQRTKNLATPVEKRRALSLSVDEALQLARWAKVIEADASERAGKPLPMDIEWAKDGESGQLFILQARPETVESRRTSGLVNFQLEGSGEIAAKGQSVGTAIASGNARVVHGIADIDHFPAGAVLVAPSTDPDWVPAMRKAAAVVTEHGGRTCHAAIVSRELGIPAVVGAADATRTIKDGAPVTVSCAQGDEGVVFHGTVPFKREEVALDEIPRTKTKVMINLADPSAALRWWRLPADGVGLARIEFIIAEDIRVHPMALCRFDEVKDRRARREIERLTAGYADKAEMFVDKLASGVAMLAASQHPRPVIVRLSDFKTNEYSGLVGGAQFEVTEENPMIGFRGAARYVDERYRDAFLLECRAIKRAREQMGFKNLIVMIPFCRTLSEADRVLEAMAQAGLRRGEDGLKIFLMCEVPSNVLLCEEFARRVDGFSIGSNDLTQLTLGIDRDSELLAASFDERDAAVKWLIASVIARAQRAGISVGLCGQGPSDHPDFAEFLVQCGIDSMSLDPDRFLEVKRRIAEIERDQELIAKDAARDAREERASP